MNMRTVHITAPFLWKGLLYLTVLFSVTGFAGAQTHDCGLSFSTEKSRYSVVYGEPTRIDLANGTASVARWEISPASGADKSSGEGNTTGDITFSKPGTYKVTFYGQGDATHPAHKAEAEVTVHAVGMKFHTGRAQLSGKVIQGASLDGITLSIPVEIASFTKEPVRFGPFTTETSGIRGITVSFAKEVMLRPGEHTLVFSLSGAAAHSGRAQIGFFNPAGEGYFYNFQIIEN